jgi:hypothetical protein
MSAADHNPGGELILYQMEDSQTRLQARLEGETVWLTEAQMDEAENASRSPIAFWPRHSPGLFRNTENTEDYLNDRPNRRREGQSEW